MQANRTAPVGPAVPPAGREGGRGPMSAMSPAAHAHAEWALIDELAEQLETAHEVARELRDHPTWRWPDADLTMYLGFITATVEALDALSGQEANKGDE
jgi:hypothetical protein